MNKKRTVVAALVLSLVLVVGGILAYFTDSDERTNVFTIGTNVDITLNENVAWVAGTGANADKYVSPDASSMYPGSYAAKEPTVTCVTGKRDCYVFVRVTSPIVDGVEVLTYEKGADWIQVGSDDTTTSAGNVIRVYAYASVVSSSATLTTLTSAQTTTPVFGNVTINNHFNQNATKGAIIAGNSYDLKVEAYGIQTTGMTATDLATTWGLFNV